MIFKRQRFIGPVAESQYCTLRHVLIVHRSYSRRGRLTLFTRLRLWFLNRRRRRLDQIRGITGTTFGPGTDITTVGDLQELGLLPKPEKRLPDMCGDDPPPRPFPQSPIPKPDVISRMKTTTKNRTTALTYTENTRIPKVKKLPHPAPKREYTFPLFPKPKKAKTTKKAKSRK